MSNIEYVNLQEILIEDLLTILNKIKVRAHLIPHDIFDEKSLALWVNEKVKKNSIHGCKVKGVRIDGIVAGWCGIQFEEGAYELAIVLDDKYWGNGIAIFKEVIGWAAELGHKKVILHLFNTRPEYKILKKMASSVYESSLFGESYTSYELIVSDALKRLK